MHFLTGCLILVCYCYRDYRKKKGYKLGYIICFCFHFHLVYYCVLVFPVHVLANYSLQ